LVHASKAGQRWAHAHEEGQDDFTIGSLPDESYTRRVAKSRKTVTIVFGLSADAVRARLAELQSSGPPSETTRASGAPLAKEASPRGDGQCK